MYDYTANIDYILNNKVENNKVKLQDKILNSDDFNTTFKYIEDSLNLLYQKTRTLEDIIDYTRSFLETEVNNDIKQCKTLLNEIEQNKELRESQQYIKYNVSLMNNTKIIHDRDNKIISSAIFTNNNIFTNYTTKNEYSIKSITTDCDASNVYHNNSYKSYRSVYLFDEIQSKEITEVITVKLNKAVLINSLNFNLSNCICDKIILHTTDNIEYTLNYNNIHYFDSIEVDYFDIYISTKNYIISQVDKKITKNNFETVLTSIYSNDNLDLTAKRHYYYLFGIDDISVSLIEQDKVSGFLSEDINIGNLKTSEYITLYADTEINDGSIEFSIIDGVNEIPILPENVDYIFREKIFKHYPLRFNSIDNNYIIYDNNDIINKELSIAINSDNHYVSYKPDVELIHPTNKTIKIKIILRGNVKVKNIYLKKYGGNKIWTV